MFNYPVTLIKDGETILVTFPDVPEAITFGENLEEALLQAVDALETALSCYIDAKKPLPIPSQPTVGQQTVSPSATECAKLGIYQAMLEQGIKKTALAKKLGWHMQQIDRLLDLNHASKIEQIEMAARALGKHLEMRVA